MNVLIVEDDAALAANVQAGLRLQGIGGEVALGAPEGLSRALRQRFDVVVLDVMLGSEMSGFDVCRALRRAHIDTPVLMLTALDRVSERVSGLEIGADDYMVKPFALDEVAARIRALVRRHIANREAILEVANIRYDTRSRCATVDDRRLALTEREATLLELFLHHAGRHLTQEAIHESVWPDAVGPTSNLVEVYVGRLRRKLTGASARVWIRTFKRLGYRLDPVVA